MFDQTSILVIALLSTLVYWRGRNLYLNKMELYYSHQLYKLRDRVRMLAIEDKIDPNSNFFLYLDKSICKTISALPRLNIISLLLIARKNKKSQTTEKSQIFIEREILSNPLHLKLYSEYGELIFEYFEKRHYLIHLTLRAFYRILRIPAIFAQAKSNILNLRIYPETSQIQALSR